MKLFKHILFGWMLLTTLSVSAVTQLQKGVADLNPQMDFLSNDFVVDRSKVQNFYFSSDMLTDPVARDAFRQKILNSSSIQGVEACTRSEGEPCYTVKCVFKGMDMPDFSIYNPDFIAHSQLKVWLESEETDTYYFEVPAGTYDILAHYYSEVDGMEGWANIVHENVEISSDMEVVFSEDELTEKVVIQPVFRNGEAITLPRLITNDGGISWEKDYTDANGEYLYYFSVLYRDDCCLLGGSLTLADYYFEDIVFLSNKLSDNYHLLFQNLLESTNGEFQISTTDMAGVESGVVNNYIDNSIKFEMPGFSATPLHNQIGSENYKSLVSTELWIDNVNQWTGGCYTPYTNPDIYWALQPVKSFIDIKSPVMVGNVQAETTIEINNGSNQPTQTQILLADMLALPALYDGDKWEYVNQNHSKCGYSVYQVPEEGEVTSYPGVEAYSYFASQLRQPLGNSSPILSLMSQVNSYPNVTIFHFAPNAYIGRYGEVRNCDQWTLHTVININGEEVYDNTYSEDIYTWCVQNSMDGHDKGVLEATFTNRNVLVDETIPGFNITTIKVDERNEDLCTPTTQMLIFKNTDGVITDRFEKAEEGVIEFSAGDFNWNWIDGGKKYYYTCSEADVKVEYAPYGEESFMPLEVVEIPENYYMPGFGYFYRGSLADVTMPTSNGWYDIRFTLTDKAGNEMVQHISPAFKIESNVSVAEVTVDGIKVWSVEGKVLASGSDIESMTLYSADGKLLASTNCNSLPTNGYRGMGIVKVTSKTGQTTTHKTIIR